MEEIIKTSVEMCAGLYSDKPSYNLIVFPSSLKGIGSLPTVNCEMSQGNITTMYEMYRDVYELETCYKYHAGAQYTNMLLISNGVKYVHWESIEYLRARVRSFKGIKDAKLFIDLSL